MRRACVSRAPADFDRRDARRPHSRDGRAPATASAGRLCQSIVFLERGPQTIMRERIDLMIVATGHTLIRDQRVHDRFFHRLYGGLEDSIETIIRDGLD